MVGARGFEPPTPCSQSRCATGLRHTPTERSSAIIRARSDPRKRPRRAHPGRLVARAPRQAHGAPGPGGSAPTSRERPSRRTCVPSPRPRRRGHSRSRARPAAPRRSRPATRTRARSRPAQPSRPTTAATATKRAARSRPERRRARASSSAVPPAVVETRRPPKRAERTPGAPPRPRTSSPESSARHGRPLARGAGARLDERVPEVVGRVLLDLEREAEVLRARRARAEIREEGRASASFPAFVVANRSRARSRALRRRRTGLSRVGGPATPRGRP